jgi:uncharacterized OsmC-like protein
VAQPRAKEFRYTVGLERAGGIDAEGRAPLELPAAWTPEHLVLAGLLRCTVTSLRYHASRSGIEPVAAGSASGIVTRREEDGRYAFVEIDVRLEVELDRDLSRDEVQALLAKAERDCFIGASLTTKPSYHWIVDGEEL